MSSRLVDQLAARGIRLRRVGDRLGVTFLGGLEPTGALTFIREHKGELLAALGADLPPTPIELELKAAHFALRGYARFEPHPTARCSVHGCAQRRSPRDGRYRCPACCPPSAFGVWGQGTGRAA